MGLALYFYWKLLNRKYYQEQKPLRLSDMTVALMAFSVA